MLILLSPAKKLDFSPAPGAPRSTEPLFPQKTAELAETARTLSRAQIRDLMHISEKLADLNYSRFRSFSSPEDEGKKPAVLAFDGDVYRGLDAGSLDRGDLAFAQKHIRILSGLYGLLRPLDGIRPHRLEMGTKLKNAHGNGLYAFWGDTIAAKLARTIRAHTDRTVVNLASDEYFSAVDRNTLKTPVITPVFREEKDGKTRSLMVYTKRARGLMARWALVHRIEDAQSLKEFDTHGYRFSHKESGPEKWVFSRLQPEPVRRRQLS